MAWWHSETVQLAEDLGNNTFHWFVSLAVELNMHSDQRVDLMPWLVQTMWCKQKRGGLHSQSNSELYNGNKLLWVQKGRFEWRNWGCNVNLPIKLLETRDYRKQTHSVSAVMPELQSATTNTNIHIKCMYSHIYYIYLLLIHTYINPTTHPRFVCDHSINSCVSENCKNVKHGWVRGQTRQLETNKTHKQGEWESEMRSCCTQRQQTRLLQVQNAAPRLSIETGPRRGADRLWPAGWRWRRAESSGSDLAAGWGGCCPVGGWRASRPPCTRPGARRRPPAGFHPEWHQTYPASGQAVSLEVAGGDAGGSTSEAGFCFFNLIIGEQFLFRIEMVFNWSFYWNPF